MSVSLSLNITECPTVDKMDSFLRDHQGKKFILIGEDDKQYLGTFSGEMVVSDDGRLFWKSFDFQAYLIGGNPSNLQEISIVLPMNQQQLPGFKPPFYSIIAAEPDSDITNIITRALQLQPAKKDPWFEPQNYGMMHL